MNKPFVTVFVMVLVLFAAVMPTTAFAKEDGLTLVVEHEKNKDGHTVVKAEVKGGQVEKGTYTFSGVVDEVKNESGEAIFKTVDKSGDITVTFQGTVDGEEVELTSNTTVEANDDKQDNQQDENKSDADEKNDEQTPVEEENNVAENEENKEEKQRKATLEADYYAYSFDGEHFVDMYGEILGGKKAKGKWNFTLDGKSTDDVISEGTFALAHFEVKKPGTHQAKVEFTGQVDGKDVRLVEELTVVFHEADFELTFDGKRVGGKITNAKEAEGNWYIAVGGEDEDDIIVVDHESGVRKGLSYNYELKGVKPGTYFAVVYFEGVVDGEEVGFFDMGEITIKKDGTGSLDPMDDVNPPKSTTPEHVKKEISKIKQGGKMPKTATDQPVFILIGALALLVGLVMLKFRRVRL